MCHKLECKVETSIPIEITIDKMELLRSIEIAFYQNNRPIMADILYPQYFIQGTFKWNYKLYDLTSDSITITRRIYSHDGSWVEDEQKVKP